MATEKLIVTGGGTGGHVYPGLAVIDALKVMNPNIQVHWVGSPEGMENQIVPKHGIPLHQVAVGKLNTSGGGIKGRIKTLLGLPKAFLSCYRIMKEIKPSVVLGVGGFVSGPVVLTAAFMRIPTAIWEPNAHPGMSNRWLSPFVSKIFVVFEDALPFLKGRHKVQRVGLPIRKDIENLSHKQKNIENKKLNVLVFCGSQGARTVNTVLKEAFVTKKEAFAEYNIRHQTGVHDYQDCKKAYEGLGFVEAYEYLHDMASHLEWADVIICRAGTGSVFEVAACRKPAVFIPLPWAADDHQRKNAEALVKEDAAYMILQKDLSGDSLLSTLEKIRNNPRAAMAMGQKAHRFYTPRAAEAMAESVAKGLG